MMNYPRPNSTDVNRQDGQLSNTDDVARREIVAFEYVKVRTMRHDDPGLYSDYVDVDSVRGREFDERPKPHRTR